jgi:uncharacterized protein YgbK (DUF1537 family)
MAEKARKAAAKEATAKETAEKALTPAQRRQIVTSGSHVSINNSLAP